MYSLIAESWPIARKRHRCIWCGQSIEVGEQYRHEKSIYDGFQDHRWHLECDELAKIYFADGEDEFEPYSNERPAIPAPHPQGADTKEGEKT